MNRDFLLAMQEAVFGTVRARFNTVGEYRRQPLHNQEMIMLFQLQSVMQTDEFDVFYQKYEQYKIQYNQELIDWVNKELDMYIPMDN